MQAEDYEYLYRLEEDFWWFPGMREITAALGQGGKSVAVVSIGQLLRKNGVLERLAAAGVAVDAPKD